MLYTYFSQTRHVGTTYTGCDTKLLQLWILNIWKTLGGKSKTTNLINFLCGQCKTFTYVRIINSDPDVTMIGVLFRRFILAQLQANSKLLFGTHQKGLIKGAWGPKVRTSSIVSSVELVASWPETSCDIRLVATNTILLSNWLTSYIYSAAPQGTLIRHVTWLYSACWANVTLPRYIGLTH